MFHRSYTTHAHHSFWKRIFTKENKVNSQKQFHPALDLKWIVFVGDFKNQDCSFSLSF